MAMEQNDGAADLEIAMHDTEARRNRSSDSTLGRNNVGVANSPGAVNNKTPNMTRS